MPKYADILELNRRLAVLAGRLQQQDRVVILVTLEKGFDWRTDPVADKVHPSASGVRKMADGWRKALRPLLENKR